MKISILKCIKLNFRKSPLYFPLINYLEKRNSRKEFVIWQNSQKPLPPPHLIKQETILKYSKEYGLKVLIETGTYTGKMVEAQRRNFERIYSVELDKDLFEKAKLRFQNKKKIQILNGDSGILLRQIVQSIDQSALFWLDGHFSGGNTAKGTKNSPIYEELQCILDAPDLSHVILIDDARCFGSDPDYPNIDELKKFIMSKRPGVNFEVDNDCIRITPI